MLCCAALTVFALPAQEGLRVFPDRPTDDSVVRTRPVFQIRHEGTEPGTLRSMRFRIALLDERTDAEVYVFDQRAQASGWAPGEEGYVVYLPRRPIADGSYRWSAWYWNGHEWIGGETMSRLRIDSVPPAEIDDLALRYERERARLVLSWTPVTLDRVGDPEYVARYRAYRHRASPFLRIPAHEVAVTEIERLVLDEPVDTEQILVFFSIAAEDQAGNRAGQRFATAP